eukprot:CAMPEP_0203756952 /NCGR_PEP_ID=MMETSP0098-20131031/10130_1 /ASSEMBLY_ACC=CAM_ASM_000208 /TAXON_ID=96639 /ORGANISM=" , Strain NY0313808BC1" /LENGTH=377 /DNA_ID=CAMNT_0050649013 /DNA_START=1257 /DNA_END=2386 /DNA_ORIENTATION=-
MDPLSHVNAERAVAILEDTLDKLGFLASITPDVLAHRDELSEFVGDEISRVIEEQRNLESKYEELIAMRGSLKGLANKTKYKQNQSDIQEVSRALRESTKNLCRNLKDNPNVTGNLLKIQDERNDLEELISKTISEIRQRRTFSTLHNHVEETQREQGRLAEIIEKERETADSVKDLYTELMREKSMHEKEEVERKQMITNLKDELQTIRSKLTFKTQYAKREAHAKISSTARQFQQEEDELRDSIENLRRIKEMEQSVHRDTIDFLTRKQESLLEQAAQWSEKYSTDIERLELELHELTDIRNTDHKRLMELQARWDQQVADEQAQIEEDKREKELERLRKEHEILEHRAAGKIQRLARRFLSAMAGSGDKKKKGG